MNNNQDHLVSELPPIASVRPQINGEGCPDGIHFCGFFITVT